MQHNGAFYQGLHCLQRLIKIIMVEMHHNLEISTCTPKNTKWAIPYLFYLGKSIRMKMVDWPQSLKKFHQCVISYTWSQSNSDGSVKTEPSVRLVTSMWYDTLMKNCSQSNSDGFVLTEPSELDWLQVYDMLHWWKIALRTGASIWKRITS